MSGKKRPIWELMSSSDDGMLEASLPSDIANLDTCLSPEPTSCAREVLEGDCAWIRMTLSAFHDVSPQKKSQKVPIDMWTACSGTGAPVMAMKATSLVKQTHEMLPPRSYQWALHVGIESKLD